MRTGTEQQWGSSLGLIHYEVWEQYNFVIELNIIYMYFYVQEPKHDKRHLSTCRELSWGGKFLPISPPPHYRPSIPFSPSVITTSPPSIFQTLSLLLPQRVQVDHFHCYIIFFQVKLMEAILSNSTQKLLWFEVTKMVIPVKNTFIVCVIYCNFRHTFVLYAVMETVIRKTITYVAVLLSAQLCIQLCKC